MARYALEYAKNGYMVYTSHLDMMRLFKRAFKRADLALSYSQGFNPHPKMSFAQPLSLGYAADHEYLEFHLDEETENDMVKDALRRAVPKGLEILSVISLPGEGKTLASAVTSAVYDIAFPLDSSSAAVFNEALDTYLSREEIITLKREKKSKELKPVNIKHMIRSLETVPSADKMVVLRAVVDQGSASNLSPELIVDSFVPVLEEKGLAVDKYEIAIKRDYLIFSSCFPQIEGLHFE